MWISWSWSNTCTTTENDVEKNNAKFKDHPILTLFEESNVLSRIEVTRLRSKRKLCFNKGEVVPIDLPQILWECNDLEKLYLAGNRIQQVNLNLVMQL